MRRITIMLGLLAAVAWLGGCDDSDDGFDLASAGTQDPPAAVFDPTSAALPFPTDLLFSGSTDGTLNIPVADPTDRSDPAVALNLLDGFSTVAPASTTFTDSMDPASVVPGESVRVFQVDLPPNLQAGAPPLAPTVGVVRELTPGVDYTALIAPDDTSQTTLAIVPLAPLPPASHFLVVLTDALRGVNGEPALPSLVYGLTKRRDPLVDGSGSSLVEGLDDTQAQALEPLRQLAGSFEAVAAGAGVDPNSIVLSWTFTTQRIGPVLEALKAAAEPRRVVLPPPEAGIPQDNFVILTGTLDLPSYLAPSTDAVPLAPLGTFFTAADGTPTTALNPVPAAQATVTVPLLVTLPQGERPAGGWPAVIFQHGITTERTNALAVAGALAQAGFAVFAIDTPLHGITDTESPFYAGNTPFPDDRERTYDLDVVDNVTGAPGPDGVIDASGTHFVNLASLATLRDNVRQAVADLLNLAATIPSVDLDQDGNADFDAERLHFVGHSLGAIIGGTYLAYEDAVGAATLGMPGGGLARLFEGSPAFGPRVRAGLEAAGVLPGTPAFEQFVVAAQTLVDSGDPINHAQASAAGHPIHVIEVVGGAGALPDQVVVNALDGAPLSGTEPLIRAMGLTSLSATTTSPAGIRGAVRFTAGEHASLLDPTAAPAATVEMQGQMASFMASGGVQLTVSNPDVVLP